MADLERHLRAQLSPKRDLAKAINCMLSWWQSFARFVDGGRICMTNNAAERRVRAIAVGRRNWTFGRSDRGAECAAAVYRLIQTCRLNDVDPHAWLAYVIAAIPDHPQSRLHEFLPWNWHAPQADLQPDAQAAWSAISKSQANVKGLRRAHTPQVPVEKVNRQGEVAMANHCISSRAMVTYKAARPGMPGTLRYGASVVGRAERIIGAMSGRRKEYAGKSIDQPSD